MLNLHEMIRIDNDEIRSIFYDLSKKIILPKFRNLNKEDIKFKNKTDLVTAVDIEIEKRLEKILKIILPNSLFVGEESFAKNPKIIEAYNLNNFCWTVDPIDGTSNFVNGNEKFATMLALTYKDKIIQSWIYKPFNGEFSFAEKDHGAYINYQKINISKEVDINSSIGSISSKYWDNNYNYKMQNIKKVFKSVNSYRCIGHEYIDIIKGIRDFTILSRIYPWDHIPGILLVRESGGVDSYFNKEKYNHSFNKNNLIVSNSVILQNSILKLLEE